MRFEYRDAPDFELLVTDTPAKLESWRKTPAFAFDIGERSGEHISNSGAYHLSHQAHEWRAFT
jgi:hypothetical protein